MSQTATSAAAVAEHLPADTLCKLKSRRWPAGVVVQVRYQIPGTDCYRVVRADHSLRLPPMAYATRAELSRLLPALT